MIGERIKPIWHEQTSLLNSLPNKDRRFLSVITEKNLSVDSVCSSKYEDIQ